MYQRGLGAIALGAALIIPIAKNYSLVNNFSTEPSYSSLIKQRESRIIEIIGYDWDITSLMNTFNKIKKYNRYEIGKFYGH